MIAATNGNAVFVEWLLRVGLGLAALWLLVIVVTRIVHRTWRQLEADDDARRAASRRQRSDG